MQLYLLAIHDLLRIEHILYQLTIRGTSGVDSDNPLRLVLTLLVGSLLLLILLIAVQCRQSCLICRLYRCHQDIADIICHGLIRCRVTNH